ncbi:hypothetical protein Tco_0250617 [Tanacetum coccineum]
MVNLMSQMQKMLHERPQGALPSNTEPNPREQVNSIMTRSGLITAEPSPPPHVPPTPRGNLMDALTQILKYTKVLRDLLKDKEKVEELANTLINAECSAILLNKAPEKLRYPKKFLISCVLQDLETFLSIAKALVYLYKEKLTLRIGNEDYESFCFDHQEEKSIGSTTSHSNHSLPDYEAFCFDVDHIIKESSGSTTSHSDLSLLEYESFHFDISFDLLSPADRSDSHLKEFADELAHIISPLKYDHFYFDLEDDPGELTRLLKENISGTLTRDLTIRSRYPPYQWNFFFHKKSSTSTD